MAARLEGRGMKQLSKGAKKVYIKAVVQAIASYSMGCFLLPKTLWHDLNQLLAKFWWQNHHRRQGIHWLQWSEMCQRKSREGLGFRDIAGRVARAGLRSFLSSLIDTDGQLFAFISRMIWKDCNTSVFDPPCRGASHLCMQTTQCLDEYNSVSPAPTSPPNMANVVRWTAPVQGCYKVNFDAATDQVANCGGLGVVVRNHKGEVMAAAAAAVQVPWKSDALILECLSARWATRSAHELGLRTTILEGDALFVIQKLQQEQNDLSSVGLLIADVKAMSSWFAGCLFHHIEGLVKV